MVRVDKTIIHEFRELYRWKRPVWANFDIALMRLAEEVDITVYTPVCLPVLGQDYISPDKQGKWRWAKALGKGRWWVGVKYKISV